MDATDKDPSVLGTCEIGDREEDLYLQELPQVVQSIVDTCGSGDCFEHVESAVIPSKNSVIKLLETINDLLYPGYFREQEMDHINMKYYIGTKVHQVYRELAEQISRSIRHECRRYNQICSRCQEQGRRESLAFLRKIPKLRKILASDVRMAHDSDPAAKSFDEIIFSYPGLRAITTYRIAHELYHQGIPLLPRIMTEYAHTLTGIDIHPAAEIGEHFFIDHGSGVVIGETCQIGHHVKIYQGVTLGALSIPTDEKGQIIRNTKRHPTIEDYVTIYSGASILGGDTVIGAHSVIGGNVWITESVPPYTVVLMEKPRLTYRQSGKHLAESAAEK